MSEGSFNLRIVDKGRVVGLRVWVGKSRWGIFQSLCVLLPVSASVRPHLCPPGLFACRLEQTRRGACGSEG